MKSATCIFLSFTCVLSVWVLGCGSVKEKTDKGKELKSGKQVNKADTAYFRFRRIECQSEGILNSLDTIIDSEIKTRRKNKEFDYPYYGFIEFKQSQIVDSIIIFYSDIYLGGTMEDLNGITDKYAFEYRNRLFICLLDKDSLLLKYKGCDLFAFPEKVQYFNATVPVSMDSNHIYISGLHLILKKYVFQDCILVKKEDQNTVIGLNEK